MAGARTNQAAVREINRMLLEAVRADWSFPHPNPDELVSSFAGEPVGYRERYYGTTDDELDSSDLEMELELEDEEDRESAAPQAGEQGLRRRGDAAGSPVAFAGFMNRRAQARKRRRRKALEEETSYNSGLCFFLRRRNAWTGAVAQGSLKERQEGKDTFLPTSSSSASPTAQTSGSSSSKSPANAAVAPDTTTPEDNDSAIAIPLDLPQKTFDFSPPASPESLTDVLVPVAAPIVPPSHPVRASLLARSDSELYEKIVRDNRTPAVPINLSQMMGVIVQGWKDEGNWPPPRGTMQQAESSMTGRRRVNKAVAVRGEAGSFGAAAAQAEAQRGVLANHRHLRQGVDSVRRALRLNGSAPPPGD